MKHPPACTSSIGAFRNTDQKCAMGKLAVMMQGAGRPRGRPRLIDREKIVAVAVSQDPANLTMQSVADELGVARKSLSYHVADRDELMRLVANDVLRTEMRGARDRSASGEWRDEALHYARNLRRAVIGTGWFAQYIRMETQADLELLRPADALVASLLRAGFTERNSLAGLTFLSEIAIDAGRYVVRTGGTQLNPETVEVVRAISEAPEGEFDALRRVSTARNSLSAEDQFEFDLQVAILGLQATRVAQE